jgi:hypothetical protein
LELHKSAILACPSHGCSRAILPRMDADISVATLHALHGAARPTLLEGLLRSRQVNHWNTNRRIIRAGRAWARGLGVSHTWLQKLVREFTADPSKMWRL